MANYTKEIAHMLDRFNTKILSQDREGYFKSSLKRSISLLELLMIKHLSVQELRINQLVKLLEVNRNIVNTCVSKLIKDKIIQKKVDPEDGRAQVVSLTNQGKELAKDIAQLREAELDFILKEVTINEEKTILKFLSKYTQFHTERYSLGTLGEEDK